MLFTMKSRPNRRDRQTTRQVKVIRDSMQVAAPDELEMEREFWMEYCGMRLAHETGKETETTCLELRRWREVFLLLMPLLMSRDAELLDWRCLLVAGDLVYPIHHTENSYELSYLSMLPAQMKRGTSCARLVFLSFMEVASRRWKVGNRTMVGAVRGWMQQRRR